MSGRKSQSDHASDLLLPVALYFHEHSRIHGMGCSHSKLWRTIDKARELFYEHSLLEVKVTGYQYWPVIPGHLVGISVLFRPFCEVFRMIRAQFRFTEYFQCSRLRRMHSKTRIVRNTRGRWRESAACIRRCLRNALTTSAISELLSSAETRPDRQ